MFAAQRVTLKTLVPVAQVVKASRLRTLEWAARDRQSHREDSPALRPISGRNLPAVQPDEVAADCQAEPEPTVLTRNGSARTAAA